MRIVFTNTKGGVGKSTLAAHLAVYLADHGHSVALLDADEQRSSSQWVMEAEPTITVRNASTPVAVANELKDLQSGHNFVIADAPGRSRDETRTLMLLCDLAVFPITPSILDLRSAARAIEIVEYVRSINDGRPEMVLVLNRTRVRDTISQELKSAASSLDIRVATSMVRDLHAFRDSAQQATAVSRMGYRAREAANDINCLFEEILATPIPQPHSNKTNEALRASNE